MSLNTQTIGTGARGGNRNAPLRFLVSGGRPFLLALLLLAGGFSPCLRAAETPAFQLATAAEVDGSGVYLKQLVQSSQPLPSLRLCDAPEPGKTLDLTRQQITDLLATAAPGLSVTNWTGADSIGITRRMHTLTEESVLALLTATLQRNYVKDKGDLELNFTQPWEAPTVPDEPLTVKIVEAPGNGVAPEFIVRFQVCTATETVGTWEASLQAHVWRMVWVAHSNLQRGELVSDADLDQERRDILNVRETLAQFAAGDSELEFADEIQAGNILFERNLKARTVLHRGQMADALLQDGALNIMMKVEVLEDGALGQMVRVRNPVSLRNLSGKVVNDQTVSISL